MHIIMLHQGITGTTMSSVHMKTLYSSADKLNSGTAMARGRGRSAGKQETITFNAPSYRPDSNDSQRIYGAGPPMDYGTNRPFTAAQPVSSDFTHYNTGRVSASSEIYSQSQGT